MADTVSVNWIYPPNLQDSGWDELSGNRRVVVNLKGLSDSTGETDVIKVRLSDLKNASGNIPSHTAVEWLEWNVYGMGVLLEWDRDPQHPIARLNDIGFNNGTIDRGNRNYGRNIGLLDPGDDDGTGNIVLTTINAFSGDNYDITMCLRLKD